MARSRTPSAGATPASGPRTMMGQQQQQPDHPTVLHALFDPLEAGVRTRIRSFIEERLEAELDAALGRKRYERGRTPETEPSAEAARSPVSGHRRGHRARSLMGTFGAVTVCVPRARLATPDGGTQEWGEGLGLLEIGVGMHPA